MLVYISISAFRFVPDAVTVIDTRRFLVHVHTEFMYYTKDYDDRDTVRHRLGVSERVLTLKQRW